MVKSKIAPMAADLYQEIMDGALMVNIAKRLDCAPCVIHKHVYRYADSIRKRRELIYAIHANTKKRCGVTNRKLRKRVEQYTHLGDYLCTHESVSAAAFAIKGKVSGLSKALHIEGYTYYGFIWKLEGNVCQTDTNKCLV